MKTVDVIILIRQDGTTEESPVHFTDACSDPVIAKYAAADHKTVGGGTRQMTNPACVTCGVSL